MAKQSEPPAVKLPALDARNVAKGRIIYSPTNPRKGIKRESIDEMIASIRGPAGGPFRGIEMPLIVRPASAELVEATFGLDEDFDPKKVDGFFELGDGERRMRAANEIDELAEVPVVVRELADVAFRELQLLATLQNEHVDFIDESVAFAEMLALETDAGRIYPTISELAGALSKTETYVRNRLKLRNAPAVLVEAYRDERIPLRVLEQVSRIPAPADREKCAGAILNPRFKDSEAGEVLNREEVRELIHDEFMIPLRKATFDRDDAELIPEAGDCGACPFRSGNDENLQEDLSQWEGKTRGAGVDPQLCLNPACFREKSEESWRRDREAIEAGKTDDKNVSVMNDDDAAQQFVGGELKHGSKFVDVNARPGWQHLGDGAAGEKRTVREILGEAEVPIVKARDPETGTVVELAEFAVVKTAAAEAEKTGGKKSPFAGTKRGSDAASKERAEQLKTARRERMEILTGLDLLGEKFLELDPRLASPPLVEGDDWQIAPPEFWLNTIGAVLDSSADACRLFAKWLEIEKPNKSPNFSPREFIPLILDHIAGDRDPAQLGAGDALRYGERDLFMFLAAASVMQNLYYAGITTAHFKGLGKIVGLDTRQIQKATTARIKAIDAAKKQPPAKKKSAAEPKKKVPADPTPAEVRELVHQASAWYDEQPGGTVSIENAADKFGVDPKKVRNFRMNQSRKAKSKGGAK